ncbi:MAG: hypothetical protein ACRDK5_01660, partial [Solirubrobacterales bacterium]
INVDKPPAQPATPPAQQPAAGEPQPAPTEVVVPPVPVDPTTTAAAPTTGTPPPPLFGKHKRKKGAIAESQTKATTQTAPAPTTPPLNCDANSDGLVDPGSDPACAGPGTTTGVSSTDSAPPAVAPKAIGSSKKKAASKEKKSEAKAKVKRKRASAR